MIEVIVIASGIVLFFGMLFTYKANEDRLEFNFRMRKLEFDENIRRVGELMSVCAQAYQVVGCLLNDTDQFETEHARKVLDNLSHGRMLHADVLPWESIKRSE